MKKKFNVEQVTAGVMRVLALVAEQDGDIRLRHLRVVEQLRVVVQCLCDF